METKIYEEHSEGLSFPEYYYYLNCFQRSYSIAQYDPEPPQHF